MLCIARSIVHKYGTSDACLILQSIGAQVAYVPMTSLRGVYKRIGHEIFVAINANLDDRQQKLIAGHELGHILFHPGQNRIFMDRCTCMKTSPQEKEAAAFSVCLLAPWPDEVIEPGDTIDTIASKLGVSRCLAQYYIDVAVKN